MKTKMKNPESKRFKPKNPTSANPERRTSYAAYTHVYDVYDVRYGLSLYKVKNKGCYSTKL